MSLRAQRSNLGQRGPLARRDCLAALLLAMNLALAGSAWAAERQDCVRVPIVLWGDGRHDDTAALAAWLRGADAVWAASGEPVGAAIVGHSFRLSDAVYVAGGTGRRLEEFRLLWPERGEVVAGGLIVAGSDSEKAPTILGVRIEGGAAGEGVAFEMPYPALGQQHDRASCAIS